MKRLEVFLFACLFALAPVAIEISNKLNDVGAAKLNDFTRGDWIVLIWSCIAVGATNLMSFFSTKWGDYKRQLKIDGDQPNPKP